MDKRLIQGKNVTLEVLNDGEFLTIACIADVSFSFENELISKTTYTSGLWREYRARISGYTVEMSGVNVLGGGGKLSSFYFLQSGVRRSNIEWRMTFEADNGDLQVLSGTFILASSTYGGGSVGVSEFDASFQGTGGIDLSMVAPPGGLPDREVFSDVWELPEYADYIDGAGVEGLTFEGHKVLAVFREGLGYDHNVFDAPGNREYGYPDQNKITFMNPGTSMDAVPERVTVVWEVEP